MRIGPDGIAFIAGLEGFEPKPYQCQAGKWTIGFGHTDKVLPTDPPLTRDQAMDVLMDDLREIETRLNLRLATTLNDNEWAVAVSLCFNMGCEGFFKSSIFQKIQSGDKLRGLQKNPRILPLQGPQNRRRGRISGAPFSPSKRGGIVRRRHYCHEGHYH